MAIRERTGRDGKASFQLVVHAGRDDRGPDRVLPEFGKKRISAVTTADVERWYGRLRDGDRPLGIRSIRGYRTVLSAMFSAAVRWGYPPSSPVERATDGCPIRNYRRDGTAILSHLWMVAFGWVFTNDALVDG